MATKRIAWNTGSGNITLTYQGQGDAPITVQSDANDGAARSQTITIETTKGSPVITKNLTVRQGACPVPVGTVLNYAYTGSYQEVELPAGQYKLQCWGAQGGSNAAASSYGITAQAGGKGGYSEGVLTLTSKTTVRIYVGGKGGAGTGGYNGGGTGSGTTSATSGNTFGYTKMGGGGGATDIRLSDGSLLSRMIVAGGGSGGSCGYKKVTTSSTITQSIWPSSASQWEVGTISGIDGSKSGTHDRARTVDYIDISNAESISYSLTGYNNNEFTGLEIDYYNSSYGYLGHDGWLTGSGSKAPKSGAKYIMLVLRTSTYDPAGSHACQAATLTMSYTTSSTTTSTESQVGYAGGGTKGIGYAESYAGQQNRAGNYNAGFGYGANQYNTTSMWHGGLGGGGWYGGGVNWSVADIDNVRRSGGGSGWVNIAANASYRPSGYTGLQLDSGETKAGNTSFPSTSGGTETGHSGNGYARITRLS